MGEDTVLLVSAATDARRYGAGHQILVTASVQHPGRGGLTGAQAVVTAVARPDAGTALTGAILPNDEGRGADAVAHDGLYTGTVPVTDELACAGERTMPVTVLAQATSQGSLGAERPALFAGFASAPITIAPGAGAPDLVIDLVSAPVTLQAGSPVPLEITVRNVGTRPADASAARVLLSADERLDPDDAVLATLPIPALRPGGRASVRAAPLVPVTAGRAFLAFVVDANAEVRECNEANDVFLLPVSVR